MFTVNGLVVYDRVRCIATLWLLLRLRNHLLLLLLLVGQAGTQIVYEIGLVLHLLLHIKDGRILC